MTTAMEAVPETENLTDRQYRVMREKNEHPRDMILRLAENGLTDQAIANEMGISLRTLNTWKEDFCLKRRSVLRPEPATGS